MFSAIFLQIHELLQFFVGLGWRQRLLHVYLQKYRKYDAEKKSILNA